MFPRAFAPVFLCAFASAGALRAQLQTPENDAIRVKVSVNEDGSRTAYQFDASNKKAVATTTGADGRQISKINYVLDDAGRFSTGEVFGVGNKFQFNTSYKYDANGRLFEETRLTKENAVQLKLVYDYDGAGKQRGYSVYDAHGKLLGQTTPKGGAEAAVTRSK